MTSSFAIGLLGLTLLAGPVPAADPPADARGTVRVCGAGRLPSSGVDVWVEGPSARGDRLTAGKCVDWRVKEGIYDFGLYSDARELCTSWALSRPGMYRLGEDRLSTTGVAVGQTTRIEWSVRAGCDTYSGPAPEPRVARAAADSKRLEGTEPPAPRGTVQACRTDEASAGVSDPYQESIHVWLDGAVARSAELAPGRRTCHRWTLPAGVYLIGIAESAYGLLGDTDCSPSVVPSDHVAATRRDYPRQVAVHVVDGELTSVATDASCRVAD